VPVGLYLCGGIDSAFVGALMTRNLDSRLHSFSISFVGSNRDEREFARQAADVLGTEHHELAVTKEMLWKHLEDCLWFSELPFVTLAPVGKYLLSELAKKHVSVVLTGEGADEVFLGYRSYFQNAIRDTRKVETGRPSSSAQVRRLKLGALPAGMVQKLSLLIFHRSHRHRLASTRTNSEIRPSPSKPVINAVQEARIAGMPLDILCFLGDREQMAHSLEARLPFRDHKLYDAAKMDTSRLQDARWHRESSAARCRRGRLARRYPSSPKDRVHAYDRRNRFLWRGSQSVGEAAAPSFEAGVRARADLFLRPSAEVARESSGDEAPSLSEALAAGFKQGPDVHDADPHAAPHVRRRSAVEEAVSRPSGGNAKPVLAGELTA
jgi:asparagine synthetase B (glutamine-hydrolysing)